MRRNILIGVGSIAGLAALYVGIMWLTLWRFQVSTDNAAVQADIATIAPHGVIELTAIIIASAAGLLLAAGVLAPGRLRRIDALQRNAQRAGVLILGVSAMLVLAGTIEGFYSPQRFPPEARIAMGAVTAVAMAWYFTFAGRQRSSAITRP